MGVQIVPPALMMNGVDFIGEVGQDMMRVAVVLGYLVMIFI